MWQKIKDWCYNSLTVAWAYVQIAVGFIMLGVHQLGAIFVDPSVKDSLGKLGLPAYVDVGIAVLGAITLLARLRTLNHATNANNEIIDAPVPSSTD